MKLSPALLFLAAATSTALSVPDISSAPELSKREGNTAPACGENGSWWAKCTRKDEYDSSGRVMPGEWSSDEKWCWMAPNSDRGSRISCSDGDSPPTTETDDEGYLIGYSCFAHTTNAAKDLDRFEHGGCLADYEEWKYDWGAGKAGVYKIITPCSKDSPGYPNCA